MRAEHPADYRGLRCRMAAKGHPAQRSERDLPQAGSV
jgi:hypothetical protein